MAPLDAAVGAEPRPRQNLSAEGLYQRHALAPALWQIGRDRSGRQAVEQPTQQAEAGLHLLGADPDAGVDIAVRQHRHLEIEIVVRRIARIAAGILAAAAGAP